MGARRLHDGRRRPGARLSARCDFRRCRVLAVSRPQARALTASAGLADGAVERSGRRGVAQSWRQGDRQDRLRGRGGRPLDIVPREPRLSAHRIGRQEDGLRDRAILQACAYRGFRVADPAAFEQIKPEDMKVVSVLADCVTQASDHTFALPANLPAGKATCACVQPLARVADKAAGRGSLRPARARARFVAQA